MFSYFLLQKLSENEVFPIPLRPKSNRFRFIYIQIELLFFSTTDYDQLFLLSAILFQYFLTISMSLCHWFEPITTHLCSLIQIRVVLSRNIAYCPIINHFLLSFFFCLANNGCLIYSIWLFTVLSFAFMPWSTLY